MRAIVAEAYGGSLFTDRLVQQAGVGAWDPFDSHEGTPLRLAARNRALLCVGYAGALRVEELSQARVEHLEPLRGGYRLRLPVTKTSGMAHRKLSCWTRTVTSTILWWRSIGGWLFMVMTTDRCSTTCITAPISIGG